MGVPEHVDRRGAHLLCVLSIPHHAEGSATQDRAGTLRTRAFCIWGEDQSEIYKLWRWNWVWQAIQWQSTGQMKMRLFFNFWTKFSSVAGPSSYGKAVLEMEYLLIYQAFWAFKLEFSTKFEHKKMTKKIYII